ncbi:P-loop containing nucleoside triphosphate hydrolase protein [Lipomyces japonicus]|uniref:P-loop containing nucleoside triphosphate hydrolase protein n=1 Tax=Lipomyces japonicus TaxID=56871 RepID=UPI0034CE63EB
MSSKGSGSLLSMPKRSNSMRPPSTIPLSASSSSRLNRSSEIHLSTSRPQSPSSASNKSRRSSENRSTNSAAYSLKRKEQSMTAVSSHKDTSTSLSRSSSRQSVQSDTQSMSDTSSRAASTNKETNIHVVVRCRGRNDREVKENSGVVISATGQKDITVQTGPLALSNKTYTFDRVFGPEADQTMMYDEVVSPILNEALSGYNCTIFAYGQTGTGKTYTMSGDVTERFGTFANEAGIIPRTLYRLFQALENEKSEYSVKCSFIELYNEELRDLISKEDDRKVKIYEDTSKKGIVIQGMEESFIKSAGEGLKILQDGSHKRQVAATKCNDLSSRSHTVFTITLHVKETSAAGEEYLRIGKLNLVDLAGSENISRSGAENKRAREAGMINQSLLTLGRVINALVDRSSHIPYRESKLTRLLQDSLGGRTKTCIIATISPAKMNLEETISTLDYANRAKSIRNKPQLNQVMSKKALIKDYILEIERLKSDLGACRQKNGVYITPESFQEITAESESRRILVDEQKVKIEVMENQLKNSREQYEQSMRSLFDTKKELEFTTHELNNAQKTLDRTEKDLITAQKTLDDEILLRSAYETTERELTRVGNGLIQTVKSAALDISNLHTTVEKKEELLVTNKSIFEHSQNTVLEANRHFEARVSAYSAAQNQFYEAASEKLKGLLLTETSKLSEMYKHVGELLLRFDRDENSLKQLMSASKSDMNQVIEDIKVLRDDIKENVGKGLEGLSHASEKIQEELMNQIEVFQAETSTSYNQLGREIKSVFEEIQKHMNSQNAEIEKLHADFLSANSVASARCDERSVALAQLLEVEKKKAQQEQLQLTDHVSALVSSMIESQTKSLEEKIGAVCQDLLVSKSELDSANAEFVGGVSDWVTNQGEFQRSMIQTRDRIKQTIIESYHRSEYQGESLQESTRNIHSEAAKIVSSQKTNLATQMQSLDEFVSRARAQNDLHHTSYAVALAGIEDTVRQGQTATKGGIEATGHGLHAYGEQAAKIIESTKLGTVEHTESSLKDYGALQNAILNIRLSEYLSTGLTPRKDKLYDVPNVLPQTASRGDLLQALRESV